MPNHLSTNLVALAFITVRLLPKASRRTNIALTFSEVRGEAEAGAFLEAGLEAAAVEAKHDRTCFMFIVLPDPERPMKMMDWSFLWNKNKIN